VTLICHSFRATPLTDGRIQLELEQPQSADPTDINPTSTKLLYINDIAAKLRCDPKTVQRMSRRRRNPLPLHRGAGRPFLIERELHTFVSKPGYL
jgi:hypothetical protein